MSRPQILHSYDNHTVSTYPDCTLLTDPAEPADAPHDFVPITLDAALGLAISTLAG
jgi:hypothetical protein